MMPCSVCGCKLGDNQIMVTSDGQYCWPCWREYNDDIQKMLHGTAPKDPHGMYTEKENNTPANTWTPRLLEEAIEAVSGARNKDYGNPWENHQRTAELIEWWFKHAKGVSVIITDLDVCMINILQKASRLSHDPEHWDGWKDIAGYAGNAGVCMDVHDGTIKVTGVPQDEIGEL